LFLLVVCVESEFSSSHLGPSALTAQAARVDYARYCRAIFPHSFMVKATRNKDVTGTDKPGKIAPKDLAQPASEKRRPLKTFRELDVSASVWGRDVMIRGEVETFFSVSLERSYRDASGQYRYTRSFDSECLGRLVAVIQKASEFITGMISGEMETQN
jgi:hypothetical protein